MSRVLLFYCIHRHYDEASRTSHNKHICICRYGECEALSDTFTCTENHIRGRDNDFCLNYLGKENSISLPKPCRRGFLIMWSCTIVRTKWVGNIWICIKDVQVGALVDMKPWEQKGLPSFFLAQFMIIM